MKGKKNKHKRAKEEARNSFSRGHCPNCGKAEEHFVPPSFGELGFFTCEKERGLREL